nr:MAG TPA: hypothetical protein [Caudoviricetes sp.]
MLYAQYISSKLSTRWTFPAGLILIICGCPV